MTDAPPHDLASLAPQRVAVVLVDFQNDFCHLDACHGRTATNTTNAATALRANAFARQAAQRGMRIIYAQQVLNIARLTPLQRQRENRQRGLCIEGSWGAELFVDPVPGSAIVRKDRFDIWRSREFEALLERWGIEGLIIGGVELRCCVLFAVLGADERGYRCVVPQDLVSGQDTDEAISPIRQYLSVVYGAPSRAEDILAAWPVQAG